MTPLCDLAIKYKTDKGGGFMHHYTPVYYGLFNARRNEIQKVLEIGIGFDNSEGMKHVPDYKHGASLRMWQEFFPNAQIYGADIQESSLFNEDRIKCFYCDQSRQSSLVALKESIGGDFDIIIDDGSHRPDHYILTAKELLPLLKQDGIYLIEDVHYSFIQRVIGELSQDYNVEIVRLNPDNDKTLVDDNLAVIRNK